jgi:hypothetical protein
VERALSLAIVAGCSPRGMQLGLLINFHVHVLHMGVKRVLP